MNKVSLKSAQNAIKNIAERDGVSVDYVRKQMQLAMLNGLSSTDPQIKGYWSSIPRRGEVPTPEELIIFIAETVKHSARDGDRNGHIAVSTQFYKAR